MKTFDKKDVFSWANCEETPLNTWGYFGEDLKDLKREIKEGHEHKLLSIDSEDNYCFKYIENDSRISSPFFLPADKVKEVEDPKKWRAFRTFEEFILVLGTIGCHVRFRFKDDISNEFLALIVGFNYEAQTVTINNSIYSFKELFKKFEFYKNQEWQPFGVEVEE